MFVALDPILGVSCANKEFIYLLRIRVSPFVPINFLYVVELKLLKLRPRSKKRYQELFMYEITFNF